MDTNYDDLAHGSYSHPSERRATWISGAMALAIAVLVACGGETASTVSTEGVTGSESVSAAQPAQAVSSAQAQQSSQADQGEQDLAGVQIAPSRMVSGTMPFSGSPPAAMLAMPGMMGMGLEVDRYVAEALGIPDEALQDARTEAFAQAVAAAVADGTLTQEQADGMLSGPQGEIAGGGVPSQSAVQGQPPTDGAPVAPPNGAGARVGGSGGGFGMRSLDTTAALAAILGVSVEQIQVAEEYGFEAAAAAAVAAGTMTQTDADLMLAQRALQRAGGVEPGSDWGTRVQSALDAGAITETQAALLLANEPQVIPLQQ